MFWLFYFVNDMLLLSLARYISVIIGLIVLWLLNHNVPVFAMSPELVIAQQVTGVSTSVWTTYEFPFTYGQTPVVLATPVSTNNGDNYPIPVLRNITTTSFEMKICVDTANALCNTTAAAEDIHYFVFDRDIAATLSWIDVGIQTVTTA